MMGFLLCLCREGDSGLEDDFQGVYVVAMEIVSGELWQLIKLDQEEDTDIKVNAFLRPAFKLVIRLGKDADGDGLITLLLGTIQLAAMTGHVSSV